MDPSYIISFALTLKFVDIRTIVKLGQTIFEKKKQGKTGLVPKTTRNLTAVKPDVTQPNTLSAGV